MKKALVGLLVLLIVGAVLYGMAPAATFTRTAVVRADPHAVYRCLTDRNLRTQWWKKDAAEKSATDSQTFAYHDLLFQFTPRPFNIVEADIKDDQTTLQSFVTLVALKGDTCNVIWKTDLPDGNFLSRLFQFGRAKKIEQTIDTQLNGLQQFLQQEQNVYGFPIANERVSDTLLVVAKLQGAQPANVDTYYGLIKKLRAYIAQHGAQETNYPMLNISQVDSTHYQTMVAIPVNKWLPETGAIMARRMIAGNILVAEVKGGPQTVQSAFRQLDVYVMEHQLKQPGLPFQSLVTDRLAEPDSSKWITKLYYPID